MNENNNETKITSRLNKQLQVWKVSWQSFFNFLYNHERREIIGRDGLSWTKISLFYFGFYVLLGSFFISMLAIFAATLSSIEPRYYMHASLMASGKDEASNLHRINPGLGFRPQLDPESALISYSMNISKHERSKLLKDSLDIFLFNNYNTYHEKNASFGIDCFNKSLIDARKSLKNGFYCKYDYEKELYDTYCSPRNNYGYFNDYKHEEQYGPCVALKLNKIYNWLPEPFKNTSNIPTAIRNELFNNSISNLIENNIFIKCDGEYSSDRDAINKMNLTYYSPNLNEHNISSIGLIPFHFYPYLNQYGYESPLVFVHFKRPPRNQLINIVCKAYAANIDNIDKMNGRGMTTFQIYLD
jgi:sodium/potassium-transporting ATPase subunit beta